MMDRTAKCRPSRWAGLCLLMANVPLFAASPQTVELPLFNGLITPYVEVDVSAAVEGLIAHIEVDKNDAVQAGQVLASLESDLEKVTVDLRKVQAEMESEVRAKQLAYDFSQRNLKRITDLYEKKAVSFQQIDEAKTEAAVAAQQLQLARDKKKQAELEYRRAEEILKRRTVTSPISGVVVGRYKEPGEHVEDEPILQLAQVDPLRVEVFVPASLFGQINSGMVADIIPELSMGHKQLQGKVVMVDQVIDASSGTFGIRLEFPNPNNRIPSGLKCKVRIPEMFSDGSPPEELHALANKPEDPLNRGFQTESSETGVVINK